MYNKNMSLDKITIPSRYVLIFTFFLLVIFSVGLQFLSPQPYGPDSYYHIKVASLIKDNGLYYDFPWAKFSTFTIAFGDKDFLLHLLALPFTFLSDIVVAAKLATIFINILFILAFIYILKKYLPNGLAALLLVAPFLVPYFVFYFIKLRPTTIVTILSLLLLYFLIHKKWLSVAIIAILYPLAHISFPLVLILTLMCEGIRYLHHRDFFIRNVSAAVLGLIAGCALNPYFPNNLIVFFLNGILVPLFSFRGYKIDFGIELYPVTTKIALLYNFLPLAILAGMFWHRFFSQKKVSFDTLVFLGATSIYLLLSLMSVRFWYQTIPIVIVLFASYLKDIVDPARKFDIRQRAHRIYSVAIILVILLTATFCLYATFRMAVNDAQQYTHAALVSEWMKRNIPEKETVYHALWSDSPPFFCLNPKNNYLVLLDPIYMAYLYPDKYFRYQNLKKGRYKKPASVIKDNFQARFGYTSKGPLYHIITKDKSFKIRYEDFEGVIFEIVSNTS